MKIYSGKNLFLRAETIFASPVFTTEKKTVFFPPSGENLPTLNAAGTLSMHTDFGFHWFNWPIFLMLIQVRLDPQKRLFTVTVFYNLDVFITVAQPAACKQ